MVITQQQAQLLLDKMKEIAEAAVENNDGEYGGRTMWHFINEDAAKNLTQQFNALEETP